MAKLNKEQLKKLYDYGGTLSPKDWADMIDSVVPDAENHDDSKSVIETTYKEAKALYESGNMKKGVPYRFQYIQERCIPGQTDDPIVQAFFIDVTLTNDNQLKAMFKYRNKNEHSDDLHNYYMATSDYTFDIMYVTYRDEYNEGIFVIREKVHNICIPSIDSPELVDYINKALHSANIQFIGYWDKDSIYTLLIYDSIVWVDYDEEYSEEDDEYVYIYYTNILSKDDTYISFRLDGEERFEYSIQHIGDDHTGLLSNIDYGYKHHSFLYDTNDSAIECNIENDLDEYILWSEGISIHDSQSSFIKHSIVKLGESTGGISYLKLENSIFEADHIADASVEMIDSEVDLGGDFAGNIYLINTTIVNLNFDYVEDNTGCAVPNLNLGGLYYGDYIDMENSPQPLVNLNQLTTYMAKMIYDWEPPSGDGEE